MSSIFSKYFLFEKSTIAPANITGSLDHYDRFISTYNISHRVTEVFSRVSASKKHWLITKEYPISPSELPQTGTKFICNSNDEGDVVQDYFDAFPIAPGEKICIDTTGFIRPHLLFLTRYFYELGINSVDMLYSEPEAYQKGSGTHFASRVTQVRQVRGFEGSHNPDTEGDYLIVGCGYDVDLMTSVASDRYQATKVQMFPFPALRPHMYQENRLRTEQCQAAFGKVLKQCFAAAYDPFATADVLSRFCGEFKSSIKNLYLSPLATKPQVLGFSLFFIMECLKLPVSILFPFSEKYNQETSTGLSEIWRYQVDFDLLRKLQTQP